MTNADWVSEFAPRSQSKFLSYIVGWLAALGWQALVATTGELGDFLNYASNVLTFSQYVLSVDALYHTV